MRHLRAVLIHLAALMLLLVCAGPIALSLFASVMPDQAIFDFPPNWFGYSATLDNYRYIFTGRLPDAYLTAGANRAMISDAARQVPASMWNSSVVALGVMAVNIGLGAPAAYAFARFRFRGQTVSFLADHHVAPRTGRRSRRAVLSDGAGHGAARHQARLGPDPLDPDAALHGAHSDRVLPTHPARDRGLRHARRLRPARGVPLRVPAAGAHERDRHRAVRLRPVLQRIPVRARACPATPPTGHSRWSWRRSRATWTYPGAC